MPQLQEIAAAEAGGLLRVLLLRLGEVPADSGATWMLRLIALTGIVGATLSVASGCTWQQAYSSAQGWQRNACYKVPDQSERERCLSNSSMSYDDYRRRSEGPKRD
jgi:hypothetical protein